MVPRRFADCVAYYNKVVGGVFHTKAQWETAQRQVVSNKINGTTYSFQNGPSEAEQPIFLLQKGSCFNHCAEADTNVAVSMLDDRVVFKTTKEVAAGEELRFFYSSDQDASFAAQAVVAKRHRSDSAPAPGPVVDTPAAEGPPEVEAARDVALVTDGGLKNFTLQFGDFPLSEKWSKDKYVETYTTQMKLSQEKKSAHSEEGSAPIYMLGSTIGVTGNKYMFTAPDGSKAILPRLNTHSKPGTKGAELMADADTIAMAGHAEELTMAWAQKYDKPLHATLLEVKDLIPEELRFGTTFWTAMTLVGDLSNGNNHEHIDENDVVSVIIMLGKDIGLDGGSTVYFDGGSNFKPSDKNHRNRGTETRGQEVARVPFKHGRFQVANFEQIVHSARARTGRASAASFRGTSIVRSWSTLRSTARLRTSSTGSV